MRKGLTLLQGKVTRNDIGKALQIWTENNVGELGSGNSTDVNTVSGSRPDTGDGLLMASEPGLGQNYRIILVLGNDQNQGMRGNESDSKTNGVTDNKV